MLYYYNLDHNNLKSKKLKLILSFLRLNLFYRIVSRSRCHVKMSRDGRSLPVSSFSFFRLLTIQKYRSTSRRNCSWSSTDQINRLSKVQFHIQTFRLSMNPFLSYPVIFCVLVYEKRPLKMLSMLLSRKKRLQLSIQSLLKRKKGPGWEFTKLLRQICKIFCNFKVLVHSSYS